MASVHGEHLTSLAMSSPPARHVELTLKFFLCFGLNFINISTPVPNAGN
jgi:hypothetical protein